MENDANLYDREIYAKMKEIEGQMQVVSEQNEILQRSIKDKDLVI